MSVWTHFHILWTYICIYTFIYTFICNHNKRTLVISFIVEILRTVKI